MVLLAFHCKDFVHSLTKELDTIRRILKWIAVGLLGVAILFLAFCLLAVAVDLGKASGQAKTLKQELNVTTDELSLVKSELVSVTTEVSSVRNELSFATTELSLLKSESEKLQARSPYALRDPTYKEMKDFVAADLTNMKLYIREAYTGDQFSRDVNNSAKEKGLRCAFVLISYSGGKGNNLVAFQTVDKGLVFINPRDDKEMKVAEGVRYWRDNSYTVTWDDTIVDIIIVW